MQNNPFGPSDNFRRTFSSRKPVQAGGDAGGVGPGWTLPAVGDDVKDIIRRQRAGERLSDSDMQRLSQRTAAENETNQRGGRVEGSIQPRRLTPLELGQRDAKAVQQDKKDLAEYSAGRGFPVKPAGPSAAVLAARANGVGRAGSGGMITKGNGELLNVAGTAANATDPNRATSGGTITTSGGKEVAVAGKAAVTTGAIAAGGAGATKGAAPAQLVPAGDTEAGEPVDNEDMEGETSVAAVKKPRRDILATA